MANKFAVGIRRQIAAVAGGEIEASCEVEIEAPDGAFVDAGAFAERASQLYAACLLAVDEQLCWQDGSPWSAVDRRRRQARAR